MFVNISTIADISSTTTYKLISSSSFWPLAVDPNQPDLQLRAKTRSDTPLEFEFRPSDELGKFNICAAVGNATFCLDVFNDPKDLPHLTPWNYYAGQYWTVEPSGDGIRLSNDWTGPDWFLGVNQSSLQTHMSTGYDYPGQFWMLDQVAVNVTLPPDAPDIDRSTSLSPDDDNDGGQLSTPAIIGISLGGSIFLAAFILVVSALLFRCHRRRLRYMRQQDAAIAAQMSLSNDGNDFIQTPGSRTDLDSSSNLIPVPGGPTSPQQAHLNGLPLELESPMVMPYFPSAQRHSIYELPADDRIIPVMHTSPNYPHHPNPDEKDPSLFNTITNTPWSASPTPSTITASRNHGIARWEEVMPDGNGEITFTAPFLPRITAMVSSSSHRHAAGITQPPHDVADTTHGASELDARPSSYDG